MPLGLLVGHMPEQDLYDVLRGNRYGCHRSLSPGEVAC
jgi:hypothetical protein